MKAHFILCTVCCFLFGCFNPAVNVMVAEHNQEAYDLILRAYPCMESFYQRPTWLPDGFCDVDLFIVIENKGNERIGIDSDWNSWGYHSIELALKDKNGTTERLKRKSGTWYRNFPERIEIPPNSILCLPISLDDDLWEPSSILDDYKRHLMEEVTDSPLVVCKVCSFWPLA